jgi:hypothetical protein
VRRWLAYLTDVTSLFTKGNDTDPFPHCILCACDSVAAACVWRPEFTSSAVHTRRRTSYVTLRRFSVTGLRRSVYVSPRTCCCSGHALIIQQSSSIGWNCGELGRRQLRASLLLRQQFRGSTIVFLWFSLSLFFLLCLLWTWQAPRFGVFIKIQEVCFEIAGERTIYEFLLSVLYAHCCVFKKDIYSRGSLRSVGVQGSRILLVTYLRQRNGFWKIPILTRLDPNTFTDYRYAHVCQTRSELGQGYTSNE